MINVVVIKGRLGRDADMRETPNGKKVCSFTIASSRRGKDAGTDWIPCVAWEHTAEFISSYFHKGDMIELRGRLQSRKYVDKDGNNRNVLEVIAEEVDFGESKKSSSEAPKQPAEPASYAAMDEDDGDLPF